MCCTVQSSPAQSTPLIKPFCLIESLVWSGRACAHIQRFSRGSKWGPLGGMSHRVGAVFAPKDKPFPWRRLHLFAILLLLLHYYYLLLRCVLFLPLS